LVDWNQSTDTTVGSSMTNLPYLALPLYHFTVKKLPFVILSSSTVPVFLLLSVDVTKKSTGTVEGVEHPTCIFRYASSGYMTALGPQLGKENPELQAGLGPKFVIASFGSQNFFRRDRSFPGDVVWVDTSCQSMRTLFTNFYSSMHLRAINQQSI
jgi:hypothetical protein